MTAGIPQTKGRVHVTFQQAIQQMRADGLQIAKALRAVGNREWQNGDNITPFAIPSLGSVYDRTDINENYADCVSDGASPGTAGDVISLKTQGDILASMERAYRARHASSVRCMAHAAGRRAGHGHEKGIFSESSGPLRFVTASLSSGQQSTGYSGPASGGASSS